MISVSNKFLTWDLASSEVCRDVDPLLEGLMLGLAVSPDNRTAAAFTSINQIVVLDVMLGTFRLIERPLDPPDDILGLCVVADTVIAYNSHYWRRFSLTGKVLQEEYFHVALPVILEMIFLDTDTYIAVFWSGDFEYLDRRLEILHSTQRGKSQVITGQQAFCLSSSDPSNVTVYLAQQEEQDEEEEGKREEQGEEEVKEERAGFVIRKYKLSEGQFQSCGAVAENREEMFQLCLGGDGKDLIASVVEGFVIWPLDHGGVSGLARLLLPSEFRNVISRPSGSNSAVLNKSKDIAIAGVREFIFVWDIASEQLLKHFQAHYGRILRSLHTTTRFHYILIILL